MAENNVFRYDGPVIKILTRIANLMLLSFYWTVCCLLVVTIIPASTAMYYTVVKVVRTHGSGVTKTYFKTLKEEFKKGVLYSLLIAVVAFLMIFALNFGYQAALRSNLGLAYFILGIVFAIFIVSLIFYLPSTLSRYDGSFGTMLRLSLYFAMDRPWATILSILFLVLMVFVVYYYPPLLILVPGLYVDVICGSCERKMDRFSERNKKKEE